MNNQNIAFVGTTEFAAKILLELLNSKDFNVALVITPLDKKYNRKKKLIKNPVFILASEKKLNLIQTANINNETNKIKTFKIDYILTCAFGQFLNQRFLNDFNCLNIHPSLLPKYRGGAPINWALIQGENETGVSLMKLNIKMDSGDIYFQDKIEIINSDDFFTLEQKLINLTIININLWLSKILKSNALPYPQKGEISLGLNITKQDEIISFQKSAIQIFNKIRGLKNIGVYFIFNDIKFKVYDSNIIISNEISEPGSILESNKNELVIRCKTNALSILTIQQESKKIMDIKTFLIGNTILKKGEIVKHETK